MLYSNQINNNMPISNNIDKLCLNWGNFPKKIDYIIFPLVHQIEWVISNNQVQLFCPFHSFEQLSLFSMKGIFKE